MEMASSHLPSRGVTSRLGHWPSRRCLSAQMQVSSLQSRVMCTDMTNLFSFRSCPRNRSRFCSILRLLQLTRIQSLASPWNRSSGAKIQTTLGTRKLHLFICRKTGLSKCVITTQIVPGTILEVSRFHKKVIRTKVRKERWRYLWISADTTRTRNIRRLCISISTTGPLI